MFEFTTWTSQLSTYSLHSCLCRFLLTKCVKRTNEFSIYLSSSFSSSKWRWCVYLLVSYIYMCNYLCEVIEMSWFSFDFDNQIKNIILLSIRVADNFLFYTWFDLLFIKWNGDKRMKKKNCNTKWKCILLHFWNSICAVWFWRRKQIHFFLLFIRLFF